MLFCSTEDVVAHQAQMMEKMLKQREEKTTKVQSSETVASKEDDRSTQINIEEEIEIEASHNFLYFI